MKRLLALLPLLWLWQAIALPSAFAQQWLPGGQGIPIVCAYNSSPAAQVSGLFIYVQCDTHGELITSGGGGGGGLSVVDAAAFTYGTSPFTPGGCVYNTSITTLSSGTQGAFSCDNSRELEVTTLSSSNLATILNAAPNINVGSTPTAWQGKTAGSETSASVDLNSVVGTVITVNSGAAAAGSPRFTAAQDATTIAGAPPGRTYNTVAAGVTAQALTGGGGGATGDYLSHCVITPGTVNPGNVIILDNATTIYTFTGGTASVSTLISWPVPVGAVSTSGAWKITTGTNVTVFCSGKFT